MTQAHTQLHLGLLLTATGAHFGSWRLAESTPERAFKLSHYTQIAKIADWGCDHVESACHYNSPFVRTRQSLTASGA